MRVVSSGVSVGVHTQSDVWECFVLRTLAQKLTASYCSIGPEGAAALGDVLANPDCALGHLDLMVCVCRRCSASQLSTRVAFVAVGAQWCVSLYHGAAYCTWEPSFGC